MVVSIMQQLKLAIFDRFQLAVKYLFNYRILVIFGLLFTV